MSKNRVAFLVVGIVSIFNVCLLVYSSVCAFGGESEAPQEVLVGEEKPLVQVSRKKEPDRDLLKTSLPLLGITSCSISTDREGRYVIRLTVPISHVSSAAQLLDSVMPPSRIVQVGLRLSDRPESVTMLVKGIPL